jgi:hypothetical protein
MMSSCTVAAARIATNKTARAIVVMGRTPAMLARAGASTQRFEANLGPRLEMQDLRG